MLTKVTVAALNSWPVKVIPIDPANGNWWPGVETVKPNETRDFYVHNTQDLIIHEVQPNENSDDFDDVS